MNLILLFLLFALTALVYAMAGFGGGSTYSALLVLNGADHRIIPLVALICNLIVVSGGVFHHVRAGNLKTGLILPFALTSVPMALVGGSLAVSEQVFRLVLGTALVLGGLMMLKPIAGDRDRGRQPENRVDWRIATPIGAVLGLLAGVTGIGGGIYLAPVMHLAGWAESRVVAATTSAFILVNSLAALAGHLGKWPETAQAGLTVFLWLPLAVFLGGQVGSILGVGRYGDRLVRVITMVLVFYVGIRLLLEGS